MILDFKNIKIENIKLKKPNKINEKFFIIPLVYNNQQLIIQTPKLKIPKGIVKFGKTNKKYLNFVFPNFFGETHKFFFDFLKKLDKHVKLKINEINSKTYVSKKKYKTSLKINVNSCVSMRFNEIDIFDNKNNRLDENKLNGLTNIFSKAICFLSCVWVKGNNYGLIKMCLQLKIYKNIKNNCLILDDEIIHVSKNQSCLSCPYCEKDICISVEKQINKQNKNILENSEYVKFVKMYNVGVPKVAIYHKIKNEGLDKKKFDDWLQNKKTHKNVIPDSSKNLSIDKSLKNKISKFNKPFNFGDLLNGKNKLKKTKIKKKKNTLDRIKKQSVNGNYKVPTLNDIIDAIKSLKSRKNKNN